MRRTTTALLVTLCLTGIAPVLASSGDDGARPTPPRPGGETAGSTTPPPAGTIAFSHPCARGGSRTVNGTFDTASGALDVTLTLDQCASRNVKVSGTDHLAGTLRTGSDGLWTVNLVETVDTTFAGAARDATGARRCTITQDGSYDPRRNVFTGTITRTDCTSSGTFHEELGLAEWLMKRATRHEDDES